MNKVTRVSAGELKKKVILLCEAQRPLNVTTPCAGSEGNWSSIIGTSAGSLLDDERSLERKYHAH